jgi:hypothetical protein
MIGEDGNCTFCQGLACLLSNTSGLGRGFSRNPSLPPFFKGRGAFSFEFAGRFSSSLLGTLIFTDKWAAGHRRS